MARMEIDYDLKKLAQLFQFVSLRLRRITENEIWFIFPSKMRLKSS